MYNKINIGDSFITNEGYTINVIKKSIIKNYTVQFIDIKNTILDVWSSHLKTGKIRNPNYPSIYERGYVGQGE